MFGDFLYLLRRSGLKISLTEWMALMEALDKGLEGASLTGFYYLCRALLVKTEADFDRFDRAFLEYFKDVPFEQEVSQELLDRFGAVSAPVAQAMAQGARRVLGCDIALSSTGVAGPDRDDRGNEVGTMFVAIATADGTHVRELHLGARPVRARLRTQTATHAFDLARRYLSGLPYEETV